MDSPQQQLDNITKQLEQPLPPETAAELHFSAGKILFQMGQRGRAIAEYAKAVELNPECSRYATALEFSRDIENFYNPDLLNP